MTGIADPAHLASRRMSALLHSAGLRQVGQRCRGRLADDSGVASFRYKDAAKGKKRVHCG